MKLKSYSYGDKSIGLFYKYETKSYYIKIKNGLYNKIFYENNLEKADDIYDQYVYLLEKVAGEL